MCEHLAISKKIQTVRMDSLFVENWATKTTTNKDARVANLVQKVVLERATLI